MFSSGTLNNGFVMPVWVLGGLVPGFLFIQLGGLTSPSFVVKIQPLSDVLDSGSLDGAFG